MIGSKKQNHLIISLIFTLILLSIPFSTGILVLPFGLQVQDLAYSFNPDTNNWSSFESPFDDSVSYNRYIYVQANINKGLLSNLFSQKLDLRADDCIEELIVNDEKVFIEKNCIGCSHCESLDFDLSTHLKSGENKISIKVVNLGGRGLLSIESRSYNLLFKTLDELNPSWFTYLLIALAFLFGRKYLNNYFFAIIILTLISLTFLAPMLQNLDYWGVLDWDQHQFYAAVPQDTILLYHQIPLWNPYYCGGAVLLANPQSRVFDPFSILTLPLDVMHGIKIQILLYLLLGMVGCYLLARHLGVKDYSAYTISFIFMLSGYYAQHLAAGHSQFMVLGWVPWVYFCYLKSFKDVRYSLLSSLFLAFIFFGGTYVYAYTILLLVLDALSRIIKIKDKKILLKPLALVLSIILLSLLLSSVKLIPVIELTQRLDSFIPGRLSTSSYGLDLDLLKTSLFDRSQFIHGPGGIESQAELWHEYGAYIGYLALLLALIGIVYKIRENKSLIFIALVFLALSMGSYFIYDLWSVLRIAPLFNALRIPSRYIIMFVFAISGLACIGLDRLERKIKFIAPLILLLLLFDLAAPNMSILETSFAVKPDEITISHEFMQATESLNHPYRWTGMYPQYLSNKSTLNCYEVFKPPVKAVSYDKSNYRGESYLAGDSGSVNVIQFTPNSIVVTVESSKDDTLVLNQNYVPGWRSTIGEVKSFNGLISVDVTQNTNEVTFYYFPTSFIIGLLVTLTSMLAAIILFIKPVAISRLIDSTRLSIKIELNSVYSFFNNHFSKIKSNGIKLITEDKLLLSFVTLFLLFNLLSIQEYGITWDEPAQYTIGEVNFNYLTGVADKIYFSHWSHAHYGPLYEIINYPFSKILNNVFNLGYVASHHVLGVLTFTISLLILYTLLKKIFNPNVALYSIIFLALYPRVIAHMHYNSKDIPVMLFSAITLFLLYYMVKKKTIVYGLLAGISFGVGASIKLNILFILPIFLISYTVYLISILIEKKPKLIELKPTLIKLSTVLLVFTISAVSTTFLLWPSLWTKPSLVFETFDYFTNHAWPMNVLYLSDFYSSQNLPWHYLSTYLLLVTPLTTIIFSAIGFLYSFRKIINKEKTLEYLMILSWVIVPLLYSLKSGLVIYDGMRHFFFIIPAVSILAALGLKKIIDKLDIRITNHKSTVKKIVLTLVLLILLYGVLKTHPVQGSYFNEIATTIMPSNIEDQFEIEYWGAAYKQGMDWMDSNALNNSRICSPVAGHLLQYYETTKNFSFGCDGNSDYVMHITRKPYVPKKLWSKFPCEFQSIHNITLHDSNLIVIYSKVNNTECGKPIKDWLLCGVFPNPGNNGFNTDYIMESKTTPKLNEPCGDSKWFHHTADNSGLVDLTQAFQPKSSHTVAYLASYLHSPEASTIQFWYGNDDRIKIWLNGKLIHIDNNVRGTWGVNDYIKIDLNKGGNKLLIKIENQGGGWRLYTLIPESIKLSIKSY